MNSSLSIDYDYLYKVVVVGPSGCGKSSLLTRLVDQKFNDKHISTIGVDFKTQTIDVQLQSGIVKTIKLQIWDTAGQERFYSIASQYYRGAHCVIFVFGYDDAKGLEGLKRFIEDAEPFNVTHRILLGNKCDLLENLREVQDLQVRSFRAEYPDMTFVSTSAKTGENVNEAFEKVATTLAELQSEGRLLADGKDPLKLPTPRENDEVVTQTGRKCCGGTG